MHRQNSALINLPESATVAIADRVRSLRAAGRHVIGLQTGDPDFPTPRPIIEAAYRSLKNGETHYSDSRGLPHLRQLIADKLFNINHAHYDPATEILVTCGGVHAYYCALQSILTPGDEVLVPDPSWMTHGSVVELLHCVPVRIPSFQENNFWPTFESWERAVSNRTVALVINSPNNPTGAIADRDYLLRLNEFAAAHDLYVISDEVYESIIYGNRKPTCFAALPGAKAHTLTINSLSKTYAMTGWRVGYLAAPAEIVSLALKSSQYSITNVAPFVQEAAVAALSNPELTQIVDQMKTAYALRRELVMSLWREFGHNPVKLFPPAGAFYFFLDLRAMKLPAVRMAESLLDEAAVAVVPGSAFGESGEGYLRMTIAAANAEIEAGFTALLRWACGHLQ